MTLVEHFEHHYGHKIFACLRILNNAREKFRKGELDKDEIYSALEEVDKIYDEPVYQFIEDQVLNKFTTGTTSSQITDLGLKVNHRYGTEMTQVLYAIQDFGTNLGIGEEDF